MFLPEGTKCGCAAFEDVAFHGPVEISEVGAKTVPSMVVDFGAGTSAFPRNAAVLPECPVRPHLILTHETLGIARGGEDGAGAAFVGIQRQPVGGATDLRFGGRARFAQQKFEVLAVLQVCDWDDASALFHSVHEAGDIGEAGLGVIVTAEEKCRGIPGSTAGNGERAVDELVGLIHGVDVTLQAVVDAWKQARTVGRCEKTGTLAVEVSAFPCTGDQALGAIGAQT